MTMDYSIYNAEGKILSIVGCDPSEVDVAVADAGGVGYLEGAFPWGRYRVHLGTAVEFPLRPSPLHTWNWQAHVWADQRTMEQKRQQRWEMVKQWRTQAEFSTFIWDGSVFDADEKSAARIAGAFALALASQMAAVPYSQVWTLADNTTRELSAADMVEVGVALGAHVAWTHNRGRELRVRIEDPAATAEEIEAVVW